MNPYVKLARQTIETYLKTGEIIKPPKDLSLEMLNQRAGVFVSLHNKNDNSLRGCIGTFLPTEKNIAQEIISNAISSTTRDPRFLPLTQNELADLEISVDVLSSPRPIKNINELNPKKYGILIKTQDDRSGLLLPDLEGVDTVEQQIAITCQKGGIDPQKDKINIYQFTVTRYKE